MSQAIVANGTLLKIGDGAASPEHFTTVPEVKKLTGPSVKTALLDATSHDSGHFREYVPGMADGDNIAGDLNWRPSNALHTGMREDSYDATLRNFKVVFPDTSDNTVDAACYVTDIVPSSSVGELLSASFTLKVTGEPIWS